MSQEKSNNNEHDVRLSLHEENRCYSRLLRVVDTIVHKTDFFAKEFLEELHSEQRSLVECWRWVRELAHVVDVSIDPEDIWPSIADDFIEELLLSKTTFVAAVRKSLSGKESRELLLECGEAEEYNPELDKEVYRNRLNEASDHARHFLDFLNRGVALLSSEISDPDNR